MFTSKTGLVRRGTDGGGYEPVASKVGYLRGFITRRSYRGNGWIYHVEQLEDHICFCSSKLAVKLDPWASRC